MKSVKQFWFPAVLLLFGVLRLAHGITAYERHELVGVIGNAKYGTLTPTGEILFGSALLISAISYAIASIIDQKRAARLESAAGASK